MLHISTSIWNDKMNDAISSQNMYIIYKKLYEFETLTEVLQLTAVVVDAMYITENSNSQKMQSMSK